MNKKDTVPLIIIIVFLIYTFFLGNSSCQNHWQLRKENKQVKQKIEKLEVEILKNKEILKEFDTPQGREKIAREKHNFKKENEDVFVIEYDTIN